MSEVKVDELIMVDRRKAILDTINRDGKVLVADLSRQFGTSVVTIRNDLAALETEGLLERVHGGAVSTYKSYYTMAYTDRLKTNEPEKRQVAVEAASLVSDGDTIILGSGTTTLFVGQELRALRNLTILTNSLYIAQEVRHCQNIDLIFLGGNLNPQYQFTYGDDAINQLSKYKCDKLILSSDGVSAAGGVTTYHHMEAELNRQMIARVNRTIVVADYSKIGRVSFSHIVGIDGVDVLITNKSSAQEEIAAIAEHDVEIRQV